MSDTITITGNVATAPDNKRTQSGLSITSFRVASGQRRYDSATGTWIEAGTNWYNVSAFRGLADHAFESLKRGDRVVLTGRLRLRQWDNGVKQGMSADIEADAIGHDLRWGTTVYTKAERQGGGDSWAAPASHAAQGSPEPDPESGAAEWGIPAAPDDARALTLAAVETPF